MKRFCPRTRIKKVVKKYDSKLRIGKSTELLIFLNYMLFLKRLAKDANTEAVAIKDRFITSHHINAVVQQTLKSFRG
ncbi:centromere protein W-like [Antedon mediterranea]|uniref:centromere protein W-like n=1 Tax=Antedon mediterranea TaxID=105859 RepID=UPI003AF8100C